MTVAITYTNGRQCILTEIDGYEIRSDGTLALSRAGKVFLVVSQSFWQQIEIVEDTA